ncbi:MAG: NAD(P)-binding domain-containing protein [Acidimicrobiales bacterium]|jgi:predicted dinucleotide-binding enzyme|nr:NAD(P)-binding domain-containing protein [Acidimicrobiales bacterium]
MEIAVIGTGFIGGILGRALAGSGHTVTFGARRPDENQVAEGTTATVATIPDAVGAAEVIILAVPGAAVADLSARHGDLLAGKLVIDATNQMGQPVANARASLPPSVRYARAFNTLGGENMAQPQFADGPADMFFSAGDADRAVVEEVIRGVGLNPVDLGEDHEELVDALFRVWIALAIGQGRGRRLALRLIDR